MGEGLPFFLPRLELALAKEVTRDRRRMPLPEFPTFGLTVGADLRFC
jgi:hypothetical protein